MPTWVIPFQLMSNLYWATEAHIVPVALSNEMSLCKSHQMNNLIHTCYHSCQPENKQSDGL